MSLSALVVLVTCLGIGLIPVWLLRRQTCKQAHDYFVSSQATPPGVIQNSSIAGALRMAAFAPLFVSGASGDLWPAVIGAVFLGLGIYLICVMRRPILAFLAGALGSGQSVTVHEFIARQHGNDPRVRLLAASLSLAALLGLVTAEICAVAIFVQPLLPGRTNVVFLLMLGLLVVPVVYAMRSGNSGAMQTAQLQLGVVYLSLFGSTVLLLYLSVAALAPFPPYATLAIELVAVFCAALVIYRRSKYVDTAPIGGAGIDSDEPATARFSLMSRLLRRFEKILNVCISVFAVLIIVVAFMQFDFVGLAALAHDSAAVLQAGTRVPIVGLLALMLLPLFYPIADMTNWQRLAAFEKGGPAMNEDPGRRTAVLRKIFKTSATESSLLWLFMWMFGAIAAAAAASSGDTFTARAFMQRLAAGENVVATLALWLLLVGLFTIAVSAMSAMLSASLCTIRYDILPALRPELTSEGAHPAAERTARRYTSIAGGAFCLIAIILADAFLHTSFTGATLLALLFAFCCAQLSFVPLILGPMMVRTSAGGASVSPGWALVILVAGAAGGAGAAAIYLATGFAPWQWAAVPACLGSGFGLFAVARLRGAGTARAA